MLAVHLSAGVKPAKTLSARDTSGTLRTIKRGQVRTSAGLKTFFQSFSAASVTLSRPAVFGVINSSGSTFVNTVEVTVTLTGAIGAVTYAWNRTGAPDGHTWTIANPDSATTWFVTSAAPGEHWSTTFACTVTDSTGRSATSADVTANCFNNYSTTF